MKLSLRAVLLIWAVLAISGVYGENFDAKFSGPALMISYPPTDKPEKTKYHVVFDLTSQGTCTVTFDGGSSFSGNWYRDGRYVFLKFPQGAVIMSGRLLLKGKPGSEKGLSGIFTTIFNNYIGFYKYKVNLRREVL